MFIFKDDQKKLLRATTMIEVMKEKALHSRSVFDKLVYHHFRA